MAIRSREELTLADLFARTLGNLIALTGPEEPRTVPTAGADPRSARQRSCACRRRCSASSSSCCCPRCSAPARRRHLPRRQALQPQPRASARSRTSSLVRGDDAGRARGRARRREGAGQAGQVPDLRPPAAHRHAALRLRARPRRRRARAHHRHRRPHQRDPVLGPGRHRLPVRGLQRRRRRLRLRRGRLPARGAAPPAVGLADQSDVALDNLRLVGDQRYARDARPAHGHVQLPPSARARGARARPRAPPRAQVAFVMLDIDGFATVNEAVGQRGRRRGAAPLGRPARGQLRSATSSAATAPTSSCSCCPRPATPRPTSSLARLRAALGEMRLRGRRAQLHADAPAPAWPPSPTTARIVEELVAKATTTMYVAKSRGAGQIGFYSPPRRSLGAAERGGQDGPSTARLGRLALPRARAPW